MNKTETIFVRLSEKEKAEWTAFAEREQMSLSELIRAIMRKTISDNTCDNNAKGE